MKLHDLHIRDPFVLPWQGIYYLYGTRCFPGGAQPYGFDVYQSRDLLDWSGPTEVFAPSPSFWSPDEHWAPEVHTYQGRFFMLATFKGSGRHRGTQILVSDVPTGPFVPHSDGAVTPWDWECLDGTLYVENGMPYIVFCNEWAQVVNGTICARPLSPDLSEPAGEAFLLFRGADPEWALKEAPQWVTDGPFMYRAANGELLMLWATFAGGGYLQAVARSENGRLDGRWSHDKELLFREDGGHGMLFRSFEGELLLALHQPNHDPDERPHVFEVNEEDGRLMVWDQLG